MDYVCIVKFTVAYYESVNLIGYITVVYLTNRFHVAVRLFSTRSQMTSKCGKNKKVAHEAQPSVSLMFLPHFDDLCCYRVYRVVSFVCIQLVPDRFS